MKPAYFVILYMQKYLLEIKTFVNLRFFFQNLDKT